MFVFFGTDRGKGCQITSQISPGKKFQEHNFCSEKNLILIGHKFLMGGKFATERGQTRMPGG